MITKIQIYTADLEKVKLALKDLEVEYSVDEDEIKNSQEIKVFDY